jgi:hypothetical protein
MKSDIQIPDFASNVPIGNDQIRFSRLQISSFPGSLTLKKSQKIQSFSLRIEDLLPIDDSLFQTLKPTQPTICPI